MREILFRGKHKDNGEWVYGGSLLQLTPGDSCYIAPSSGMVYTAEDDAGNIIRLASNIAVVIPETVGQFTGLLDKNGTKIFEGDIVHILGDPMVNDWKDVDYNALIAFLDGGFCALDGTVEDYGFRRYALERMDFSLEVIGTIHDNPELMEVE